MNRGETIRSLIDQTRAAARRRNAAGYDAFLRYLAAHPELAQAERAMVSARLKAMRSSSTPEDKAAAARAEADYNALREAQFRADGKTEADFTPPPLCPHCGDTGYTPAGRLCGCILQRYIASQRESNAIDPARTFSSFSLEVFDGTKVLPRTRCTQRARMAEVVDFCRRLCAAEGAWDTVTFSGGTGLGKTYLMHCMANAYLERGLGVVLCDAYRVNRAALSQEGDQGLEILRDADVLLVDDLGAEPLLNKITGETMFMLLNHRQNEGLPTIFSTNLTMEELQARYGQRFSSRLADRARAKGFLLEGEDLRRGLKGSQPGSR